MSLPSTQAAASGPDSAGEQRAALKVMTLKVTASFQLNGVFCGSVLPSAHASAAAAGRQAGGRREGLLAVCAFAAGGHWACVRPTNAAVTSVVAAQLCVTSVLINWLNNISSSSGAFIIQVVLQCMSNQLASIGLSMENLMISGAWRVSLPKNVSH